MGNTALSIRDLSSASVADLLVRENVAYQPFAKYLCHGGLLSLVDGNFLLSLDLEKQSDANAFSSVFDTIKVKPFFVRKALENLLKKAQRQSSPLPLQEKPVENNIVSSSAPATATTTTTTTIPNNESENRNFPEPVPWKILNRKPKEPATAAAATARSRGWNEVVSAGSAALARISTKTIPPPQANNNLQRHSVQLFMIVPNNGKPKAIRLGLVTPVVITQRSTQNLWEGLTNIYLEGFTTEAWARQVDTNMTIETTNHHDKNEIAGFLRELNRERKSAYGRIRGEGSSIQAPGATTTGALVISHRQSKSNEGKGQLVCRLEKDIRDIKGCSLAPMGKRIYVGRLDWEVNEQDLKHHMESAG